jgi:hypothetical protein
VGALDPSAYSQEKSYPAVCFSSLRRLLGVSVPNSKKKMLKNMASQKSRPVRARPAPEIQKRFFGQRDLPEKPLQKKGGETLHRTKETFAKLWLKKGWKKYPT